MSVREKNSISALPGKRSVLSLNASEFTEITHTTTGSIPKTIDFQPVVKFLNLLFFKSIKCDNSQSHSHKTCAFFHSDLDRRRVHLKYQPLMCESKPCPFGDNCKLCHSRVEQLYHSENYKKKFCSYYPQKTHNCEYREFCSFAHSEEEISIELIHNFVYDEDFFMFSYKTVWCPFNLTKHDKKKCVYAHNLQDYRRNPGEFHYSDENCKNWDNASFIYRMEDGCVNKLDCSKSHGWKESEFHPMQYKTRPCLAENECPRGLDCPFFHSPIEKRVITDEMKFGVFIFGARNRITSNTFKQIQQPINPNKKSFFGEIKYKNIEEQPNEKDKRHLRLTVPYRPKIFEPDEKRRASDQPYIPKRFETRIHEKDDESSSDDEEEKIDKSGI